MIIQRLTCAALLLTATACGVSQGKLNEAKSFVKEGLEVWKKGGKPADLTSLARPIEFHEGMWNTGETLVSYEMGRSTYHARDKAIRCEVSLTVRNRQGKQKTENVIYDVKLDSPIKVMNNPMP